MNRIAVLTSSRADYGIYLPLLKEIKKDSFFNLKIIVFGTHLSFFHGYTMNQILSDGFKSDWQIESLMAGDSPNVISTAIGLTSLKFADFWRDHQNDFDLVFCLGDRYEMFAAVIAAIPYNIPFAHIHGGEKTLGVFDNVFRHSITLASRYHFVSCEGYGKRVAKLTESERNIFIVGSLGLENLRTLTLLSKKEFLDSFGIDLNRPTILVTLHPETVSPEKNGEYSDELAAVLFELTRYQVIITLPNADTLSSVIRKRFLQMSSESGDRISCFENLGSQGYLSAMKYCSFLIGNSSSGIIEAASLGKWVINLGKRQEGRLQSRNIWNVSFDKDLILNSVKKIEKNAHFKGKNIYYKKNSAKEICSILKKIS